MNISVLLYAPALASPGIEIARLQRAPESAGKFQMPWPAFAAAVAVAPSGWDALPYVFRDGGPPAAMTSGTGPEILRTAVELQESGKEPAGASIGFRRSGWP